MVRQLVSKVNMAVYTPSTQKMHFTLPKHMTENASEQDGDEASSVVIVSIPFDSQRFPSPDTFNFTNSIWDEIENIIETGEVQAGAEVALPQATTWLLGHTRESGHVLFSMVTPAEWGQLLNVEAPDVRDAVQKMLGEILKNVNLPSAVQGDKQTGESSQSNSGEGV
ncbi:hypothetical protein EON65_33575 [archaeon]|nr:MAG: hypothetical protein EON65_33575 [archaeon]